MTIWLALLRGSNLGGHLKTAPPDAAVRALQAAITGPEVVRAVGKQAYIVFPNGMGRSRPAGRAPRAWQANRDQNFQRRSS